MRRLLIGLGRDLDLADDLLQETYVRARAGFASYRGGNARAWLGAIARNVFRNHARQRHLRLEVPLEDHHLRTAPALPDRGHLDVLVIREAIHELPPDLRASLVMKHYGEFTYREIADQLSCPVGTVKWRVSQALARLRSALAPQGMTVARCTSWPATAVLDYLYGILPDEAASQVQSHLTQCPDCRRQTQELGRVVSVLDTLEGDHKLMHMVDVDDAGYPILYWAWTFVNSTACSWATVGFNGGKDYRLEHLHQDDAELSFEVGQSPECEHRFRYEARLARAVPPGERGNLLGVCRPESNRAAKRLGNGRFRFWWRQCPGENETAYLQAIRLPNGASLLSTSPRPNASRTDRTRTLVWRCLLPPMQRFESTVEYAL